MPDNNSGDPQPKRFLIAFSFAGEKRDFVEKVAHILAERFGEDKILYDKFHEAEFAVFDLGIKLPKLYGGQSDLDRSRHLELYQKLGSPNLDDAEQTLAECESSEVGTD